MLRQNYATKHTGLNAFIPLKISATTLKVIVKAEDLQFVDVLVDGPQNQFIM